MPLEIFTYVNGPYLNNTFLLADSQTRQAVVVDPSFECQKVLDSLQKNHWKPIEIWLTHGHFDHCAGDRLIAEAFQPILPVRLHPDDLELWRDGGNSKHFGPLIDLGPEPSLTFQHGQKLFIGETEFDVRHAPGHTLGHVIFYAPQLKVLLCGDVIFRDGIGRTDLPGASNPQLIQSIREQVLTLPEDTRLLSGHGAETSVGREKKVNPFLV